MSVLETLPATLYFEDFEVGMVFTSPTRTTLSEADIIAFAQQHDPQPFHTDPIAAKTTFFDGLAASGWQTALVAMRQFVDMLAHRVAGGLIGMSIDQLRWPRPTRPGDTLQASVEILGKKASRSKPGFGSIQLRWVLHNQHGELAMSLENSIWLPCRPQS